MQASDGQLSDGEAVSPEGVEAAEQNTPKVATEEVAEEGGPKTAERAYEGADDEVVDEVTAEEEIVEEEEEEQGEGPETDDDDVALTIEDLRERLQRRKKNYEKQLAALSAKYGAEVEAHRQTKALYQLKAGVARRRQTTMLQENVMLVNQLKGKPSRQPQHCTPPP
jgi:hypothetical protein